MIRMDFVKIAREIKRVLENVDGCSTKTTPKKGEGFVPYNRFNLKWGQVDVAENKVRIVLDLFPKRYFIEDLTNILSIPIKKKGDWKTGMFIKPTENSTPYFDALEISLYEDYFKPFNKQHFSNLLEFIEKAAEESSFKNKSTSR